MGGYGGNIDPTTGLPRQQEAFGVDCDANFVYFTDRSGQRVKYFRRVALSFYVPPSQPPTGLWSDLNRVAPPALDPVWRAWFFVLSLNAFDDIQEQLNQFMHKEPLLDVQPQ